MQVKEIDLGYVPRPWQAKMHSALKRFNVVVFHRRGGKTYFSGREMVDQGLRCQLKNPQYAYIAPTYGQAKKVAWEYFKDFTRNIPGVQVNEAELRIDVPRPDRGDKVRFMLLGAENPDSLRGIYLDGCIIDEYAQCHPDLWDQVIRPALSDREGWSIFIGTPKGRNHFYKLYMDALKDPDWYTAVVKASETGIISEKELAAAKSTMTEDAYMQEYECSFTAALKGAYYSKYMAELDNATPPQITSVPYDKHALVSTYWDLGISDTTAIWFIQEVAREIHVIDYIENAGVGLEWFVKEIKRREYMYDNHYIPHDGAARELGSGVSRQETLRNLGLPTRIVERQTVADGIHAVRMILNKCWFDKHKCERGIEALREYQRSWDAKAQMYVDKPLHDWSSNGADAFRQFALTYSPGRTERTKHLPRKAKRDYYALG